MQISWLPTLKYTGLGLAGLTLAIGLEAVLSVHYPSFEVRGRRAGNRERQLTASPLWALFFPLVQFFTAYASHIRAPKLRARLELWLRQADDPLGLVPSEVLGLSVLMGFALAVVGALLFAWPAAAPAMLLGLYLPYDSVRSAARSRVQTVGRSMPTMADLLVLAMESGMDFIGAVRLLVSKTRVADGKMPIRDELLMFLHQLQLGRTRRAALELLATRVPAESVRSFTSAVIQAEEKGMPLRDVLRIQAEVLRHKRIQESEAYIQTANLQMMGPVMLVIAAMLIVIVVPTVTTMGNAMAGGGMP